MKDLHYQQRKNNGSREETITSNINIQSNLDITIQYTMKPLVEQMIFFTPSVDLIVNCMKMTLIKKKLKWTNLPVLSLLCILSRFHCNIIGMRDLTFQLFYTIFSTKNDVDTPSRD